MSKLILEAQDLHKTYKDGKLKTPVINGVDFQLYPDETVAIIGSSGSGKSTLLHLLGGLDTPTQGRVSLMGQDFSGLSTVKRGNLRNLHMGFIYQFHFLLPELTAIENVMLPLRVRREAPKVAEKHAAELLDRVGLSHRSHHKPSELSGGERQRVAIARALITKPACVLADEPTGNLDEGSANQVFDLMLELNREMHTSIVMVTHDLRLASRMDRQMHISDGIFVDTPAL
ncbi:lipoprotein-releasing ABC transporter ATP-binding protein LolD [Hydrogenovibrio kuenenii]|uniref:lipoprotein-releasing ABC transporter ATP-binding protein LolD n=1 Tax=Hydrogenovibrio kuenenii TaxID=63658 RepID=UPI000466050B|nr:lipoprotein-releasing ABC transporter ATP-binding protein LolD [Hydrogenovibrio kuenenii]